jgi:hypothetical protein
MKIVFLPPAKAELTEATSYYNIQGGSFMTKPYRASGKTTAPLGLAYNGA